MQHLTFRIGGWKLVLGVSQIQEIVHSYQITPLPRTPDELEGVVNLRGYYLPVLSLKKRIRQSESETAPEALSEESVIQDSVDRQCILVTESIYEDRAWRLGLEVDEVHDCIDINDDLWRLPPTRGNAISTEYLSAMVNLDGVTFHKLNLDTVIDPDDILERYYHGVQGSHEPNRLVTRANG